MRKWIFSIIILSLSITSFAQDLMGERIRRVSGTKKSVYFDSGIFHNGGPKRKSSLKAVRHSYTEKRGYERVVLDFETKEIPRVYGNISSSEKKLYIDLFDTTIKSMADSFGKSKFVEDIKFFPISKDSLSVEITFNKVVNVDIFYLNSPGRLVFDIK
ncbi:hypothetical protein BIY24_00730 [Halobacteriovorax marinus]|uniref:Membrane protein n=1 Tax=Halobacteriovorax marinus (strain ATCC BAA-682 / DSM 15412 / SJ) TaxID=862908 RepID=E1X2C7_HALMS|nr:hypothetical protein [Halobacteriovorax marinus]ATH06517.1 hypothetical protein BIY24_00730 [Halobacteriovorax marinus]CBW25083.1 putative membrane protein [Halobacteriovorax marinus SJ]